MPDHGEECHPLLSPPCIVVYACCLYCCWPCFYSNLWFSSQSIHIPNPQPWGHVLVSWFSQPLLSLSQETESSQLLSPHHTRTIRIYRSALTSVHPDSPLSLSYSMAWVPCWTRIFCIILTDSWGMRQWLLCSRIPPNSSMALFLILD